MSEPKSVKFFSLPDTSGCPQFEPVSQFSGKWTGVAMVEDEQEIARLTKAKYKEITQAEYESAVKKKLERLDSLGDFRPVPDSTQAGILLGNAQPAARNSGPLVQQTQVPVQEQTVANITKPAKVPHKRQ